jgi:hypothetical protein
MLDRRLGWVRAIWLLALPLALAACSDCNLTVSTNALPDAVVGESYAARLDSDCGGDAWFLQSGDLPPGIGVQENGVVEGVPTREGTYLFTVGVFDFGSGETAYGGLEIHVEPES